MLGLNHLAQGSMHPTALPSSYPSRCAINKRHTVWQAEEGGVGEGIGAVVDVVSVRRDDDMIAGVSLKERGNERGMT